LNLGWLDTLRSVIIADMPEGGAPHVSDVLQPGPRASAAATRGASRPLIQNYLRSAFAFGEDAEARHRAAVDALRERPDRAVAEIARALGETPVEDFPTRSALIFVTGELMDPAALPLLVDLANEPIPPEPNPPAHGLGTAAHEIILRTTAVDAIGRLARGGDEQASAALLELVGNSVFSIRRAAVQAILSTKPAAAVRREVRAMLPADLHFLLTLKAASPADMEQPDARRVLRADVTETMPPPDPARPTGEAPSKAPRSRGGTSRRGKR
jgi:hypothetical protein